MKDQVTQGSADTGRAGRPGRAGRAGWAFAPYALVSLVHVVACFVGWEAVADPSKLLLMPTLALALLLVRGLPRPVTGWTLAAVVLSWLGDGAGAFFPGAPTLVVMLACFGMAHLCYMALFWRHGRRRPRSRWVLLAAAAWWGALLLVLWAPVGDLAPALAGYGLLLGGTAVLALRCHVVIGAGGLLFLSSDTLLALRLFLPEFATATMDGLVMLSYVAGQGLIVAGILLSLRRGVARAG